MALAIKSEDSSLTIEQQKQRAIEYVYGNNYQKQKHDISTNINASIKNIDDLLEKNVFDSSEQLNRVLMVQQILIVFLVVFFVAAILFIRNGLLKPINHAVSKISNHEFLDGSHGLREYRYLVAAYNEAREVSINNAEKLTYIAEHDKLTGVLNRMGYESVYRDLYLDKTAFILIDLDDFKAINDNHGHHVGDRMLKKISNILTKYFPNDFVCRIGGDEFAILVFDYKEGFKEELIKRFDDMQKESSETKDKLPAESLSIGIAFGTKDDDTDSLYRKADRAMYHVKTHAKSGYCFYDEIKVCK
jgi:diguanylate cyclase (GGDEF)-like protein